MTFLAAVESKCSSVLNNVRYVQFLSTFLKLNELEPSLVVELNSVLYTQAFQRYNSTYFIPPFINLFGKYLLNIHFLPGTVISVRGRMGNRQT